LWNEHRAFQYREEKERPFDCIPEGLDVLITHATPTGHAPGFGDRLLAEAIDRSKPRLHICGHDHAAYGASLRADGKTLVINPSIMDETIYFPFKVPIVVDLGIDPLSE